MPDLQARGGISIKSFRGVLRSLGKGERRGNLPVTPWPFYSSNVKRHKQRLFRNEWFSSKRKITTVEPVWRQDAVEILLRLDLAMTDLLMGRHSEARTALLRILFTRGNPSIRSFRGNLSLSKGDVGIFLLPQPH